MFSMNHETWHKLVFVTNNPIFFSKLQPCFCKKGKKGKENRKLKIVFIASTETREVFSGTRANLDNIHTCVNDSHN